MTTTSGFDHEFKFCLVGPSRVGKTSIRIRATDDIFSESYLSTVGPEFVEIVKNYDLARKVIKVTLWDGPGSEKHATESKKNAVMKNCQGALLVFDLSKRSSFEKIEHYWSMLMEKSPNAHVVLVGNKSDLVENRHVSEEDALGLSSRLCCDLYIEISALTGAGISEALGYLERACLGSAAGAVSLSSAAVNSLKQAESTNSDCSVGLIERKQREKSVGSFNSLKSSSASDKSRSVLGRWYPSQEEREASLEQIKSALRDGVQVLVYPHEGGSPEYATLFIERTNRRILWERESGSLEGLYINDLAEIRPPTENAYTFVKMRVPRRCEGKNCLFTLIGSEKAVSLGANSADQCKFLVRGLKLIAECAIPSNIKHIRGKEQWTLGRFMIIRGGRLTNADLVGLEEFKATLKRGIDVMVISKGGGRRDPKVLWLDSSESRIMTATHKYDKADGLSFFSGLAKLLGSNDKGINMDDISEIRPGFQAYMFSIQEPPPHPKEESLAVSIIGSECTISMLMASPQVRDLFVSHFQGLLKTIRPTVSVY